MAETALRQPIEALGAGPVCLKALTLDALIGCFARRRLWLVPALCLRRTQNTRAREGGGGKQPLWGFYFLRYLVLWSRNMADRVC